MTELTLVRRDGSQHTVLFDDADAELVLTYHWHVHAAQSPNLFYAVSNLPCPERGTLLMHRLLLPDARTVDHINHNGLDNRRVNLRPATGQQQQANQRSRAGSSRFKGVSWGTRVGKWQAKIGIGAKDRWLGYFTSEADAAHAYDDAAREAFGDYAYTNFPLDQDTEVVR